MDSPWRIRLLGALRAEYGRHVVAGLTGQKTGALLAYLAYHCHAAHPRDLLIDLLWPHLDLDSGRNNLRVLLHALRRQLAAPGDNADRLLVADRATVGLRSDAFTTDLQELQAALQAAARAGSPEERKAQLTHVALHSGELLPELYETWVLSEREYLREAQLQALHQLVGMLEGVGDQEQAIAYAHQAVRLDPLREESHCDLMRLYATAGQPAAAQRQYQELSRILIEELGETPSAATRALAEELRSDTRAFIAVRRDLHSTGERRPTESAELPTVEKPAHRPPAPGAQHPPSVAGRLPVQLTRFFGREEEIAWLTELLSASKARLVTVTGPGGSGKTRLAIAGAGRLEEFFGDAITFVPLVDLTDAARIPDAIADALALPRSPQVEVLDQVVAELCDQGRRAHHGPLLVLDNFEHLLAGSLTEDSGVTDGSLLVRRLLERVPTLCLLVTSRQRLGLGGEQELALLPLPTPRRGALLAQLRECASVQLFEDRAQSARSQFQLTEANAAAVAELCDRLDGLPLALELAAARAAVLSPAQLLEQMERRFELLVTRQRDVPSRHRTLLATVEGSYQALPPELQRFFNGLSVFRGGWTLEAAQAVCEERRALDFLTELRERSLVAVEARGTGAEELRYRLLETLRQYAWEQLTTSGELSAARDRHRDWCLQLAEQADAAAYHPELMQKEWLTRLEAELDNLRAALGWCQEEAEANPSSQGAEAGLRLATALGWLWTCRGDLTEGQQWLEGMLARDSQLSASLRAPALLRAAHLARDRRELARWHTFAQAARREYEQVLTLARSEGNLSDIAHTLQSLADVARQDDDLNAAWTYCVEARLLFEQLAEPVGIARTLECMAGVYLTRGDFRAARPLLEERLAICRKLGDPTLLVHALGGLGHVEREAGGYARAEALYRESLLLRRELGALFALAQSLEDLAVLAGQQQQSERAIRLLGAVEAFCETLGSRPPVAGPAEYERTVSEGRALLGEARFAAVWAEGRAMSLEEATRYAMEEPPDPAPLA